MAFAHRPKLVGASQEFLREIVETLIQPDYALSLKPQGLHLHKRLATFVRIIDYPHPKRVKNIFALDVRSFVRAVQVHGNGKRIVVYRVNVPDQAIDFCDKACLETGKPDGVQVLHALCTRANTWACKAVDIIFTFRVPCHFRKHVRHSRRLHLVFGRKATAIPHVKISRVQIHFQEELAFGFTAPFNTSLARHLRSEISQKRLGMEILAALIDFVKDAQQRCRRERELFQFCR